LYHRIGVGETAIEIAEWYKEHEDETDIHYMPYTLVVMRQGAIEQALPLSAVSPHAASWNLTSLGVGVVGDFRERMPTPFQMEALLWLNLWLCQLFTWKLPAAGHMDVHTEGRPASGDPDKKCPGPFFSVADLNEDTLNKMHQQADLVLRNAGLRF
jgi:hypothetical protein